MTGPTNGGPPFDELDDRRSGQCKHCVHCDAPPENERRAYEWFCLGLSHRRVKRPSGTCDRVLLPGRKSTVFSATSAEFGCLNFEAEPLPARSVGGGFVTIWRNGRIACRDRRRASRRVFFRKRSILNRQTMEDRAMMLPDRDRGCRSDAEQLQRLDWSRRALGSVESERVAGDFVTGWKVERGSRPPVAE